MCALIYLYGHVCVHTCLPDSVRPSGYAAIRTDRLLKNKCISDVSHMHASKSARAILHKYGAQDVFQLSASSSLSLSLSLRPIRLLHSTRACVVLLVILFRHICRPIRSCVLARARPRTPSPDRPGAAAEIRAHTANSVAHEWSKNVSFNLLYIY